MKGGWLLLDENTDLKTDEKWFGERIQKTNPLLDKWIDLSTVDLHELRILGFLFPDRRHTKSQIATKLKLWEQLTNEMLERLRREGFIDDKCVSFGIDLSGRRRTIRVYQLSEPGRFLLHQMDTHFPELFLRRESKFGTMYGLGVAEDS